MDDSEKKLQQELRDDVKALNAQVATLSAQFGMFLERGAHDSSLLKRAMFGSDSKVGLVREVDAIRRDVEDIKAEINPHPPRDLSGRVSSLEAWRDDSMATRRKLFLTFASTMVVGAAGWLVAAIQQFIRP